MKKSCRRIFHVFILLLFINSTARAQTELKSYEPGIRALFYHPVSPRAEAMGQSGVANGGSIQEIYINPAGVGLLKENVQTGFTFIRPIYNEKKSYISFAGAGMRVSEKLAVGISWLNFFSKLPDFVPSTATEGDAINVRETFITATGAYKINEEFHAGVNVSFFDHLYGNKRHFRSPLIGLGLLYEKPVQLIKNTAVTNQLFRAGISLDNAAFIKVKWQFDSTANIFPLTSYFRLGGAYQFNLPAKWLIFSKPLSGQNSHLLDVLIQLQYLNFLNKGGETSYGKWGFNVGGEVVLAKLLALRIGYLYEKREGDTKRFNQSLILSLPYRKGLTFGLGLTLPVQSLSNKKIPFDLVIDFMHRKAYKHIKENPVLKELPFTNIGLRINWLLK